MSRTKQDDLAPYRRFLSETGVSTATLQELFAQEVLNLTHDEQVLLKDNDFGNPDAWTEEARSISPKMLARAAVKATKIGRRD